MTCAHALLPEQIQQYFDVINQLELPIRDDISEHEFIAGKQPAEEEDFDSLIEQAENEVEATLTPTELDSIDPSIFEEEYVPSPTPPPPVSSRRKDYSFKTEPFDYKLQGLTISKTKARLEFIARDWGKHYGYAARGGRVFAPHHKYGRYYMDCIDYNGERPFVAWLYSKIPDELIAAIGTTQFAIKKFKLLMPLYRANPRKILFRNGVLDITTVKLTPLKEGYKGQPCGHFMDCDWLERGEGTCPNFNKLMTTQSFTSETVMWILALMGRSLFGVQDNWQLAGYLFGPGGTGKSTLLKYIATWMPVQAKRSISGSTGGSDFDSFDHNDGIRLLIYDELTKFTKLRADRLRALVSGDEVELNRKRRDQTVGQFNASIWFSGNEMINVGNSPNARDATDRRFAVIQMTKKPSGQTIKDSMIWRESQVVLRKALICYHHLHRQMSSAAYRYLPDQLSVKASNVKDQWSTFNSFLDQAVKYEEGSRVRLDHLIEDWVKVVKKTGSMNVMEKVNTTNRKKAVNMWLKRTRGIVKPDWKRSTCRTAGKTTNTYVLVDYVLDRSAASTYSDDFNHEAQDNANNSNKKLYCLDVSQL